MENLLEISFSFFVDVSLLFHLQKTMENLLEISFSFFVDVSLPFHLQKTMMMILEIFFSFFVEVSFLFHHQKNFLEKIFCLLVSISFHFHYYCCYCLIFLFHRIHFLSFFLNWIFFYCWNYYYFHRKKNLIHQKQTISSFFLGEDFL